MGSALLDRRDITENIIIIKISRSYREHMTEAGLYEATRGDWKLNIKGAERAEYAEVPRGRYEFIGEIAEKAIRDKYLGKSTANLYQRGEANPVKYFFNPDVKQNMGAVSLGYFPN